MEHFQTLSHMKIKKFITKSFLLLLHLFHYVCNPVKRKVGVLIVNGFVMSDLLEVIAGHFVLILEKNVRRGSRNLWVTVFFQTAGNAETRMKIRTGPRKGSPAEAKGP